MKPVYLLNYSCFSALGRNVEQTFQKVINKESSLSRHLISGKDAMVSSLSNEDILYLNERYSSHDYTLLEKMCFDVIGESVSGTEIDLADQNCIFIFSSTKGNIEFIQDKSPKSWNLNSTAKKISTYFNNPNNPIVVSNACISGALALTLAKRYLENGKYKHAIVFGADVISDFVFDGFNSFQALSSKELRPFDINRNGLNLGEAAACMVMTSDYKNAKAILNGAAVSNDANHLSGPSRTGEELAFAINKSLKEAGVSAEHIDFISAHGTATVYNDEMECKAFSLAKVNHAPVHSFKSYSGHTLGAAGIFESIIGVLSLEKQIAIPSLNFQQSGVSSPVNISTWPMPMHSHYFLKTASGFGGCNVALVWKKA